MIVLCQVTPNPLGYGNHLAIPDKAVQSVFERRGYRIENPFAQRSAAIQFFERQMPSAVAYMGREHVAEQPAETLAVNDVEIIANHRCCCQSETQHRSERIEPESWNMVKVDPGCAIVSNPVGKNVNFMLLGKTRGELHDIAAVAACAMIVVNDKSDSHSPALCWERYLAAGQPYLRRCHLLSAVCSRGRAVSPPVCGSRSRSIATT